MVQSCIVEAAAAARQARARPTDPILRQHTHTHTMQTAHKNRAPNTYGNPAASCLLLMCCPSLPPPSLSSLTFYCCTADIIWTVLFVRLSACGIVCFKGVSGVWLNKLGQRCV